MPPYENAAAGSASSVGFASTVSSVLASLSTRHISCE
jgi:hypothetical protein